MTSIPLQSVAHGAKIPAILFHKLPLVLQEVIDEAGQVYTNGYCLRLKGANDFPAQPQSQQTQNEAGAAATDQSEQKDTGAQTHSADHVHAEP